MSFSFICVTFLAFLVLVQSRTPSSFFTHVDQQRLKNLFRNEQPYGHSLESLYYSVSGLSFIEELLATPQVTCDAVKNLVKTGDLESIFQAASVKAKLKAKSNFQCIFPLGDAKKLLTDAINDKSSSLQLYQAISSLSNLGMEIDSKKAQTALSAALKRDESALSYGYSFYAVSYLKGDLKKWFDYIEDIIAQADEVDDVYLQFEGGLYTTAVVIDSAYKLAAAVNKAPSLNEEKVVKFTNYFLSRKHAQQLKDAAKLVEVVKTLTTNKYHIPIAVTLASQVSVSKQYPVIQIRVSNLLGQSLGALTVTADTARHIGSDAVVLNKKALTASTNDKSLYELDFFKVKPARGFYKLLLSVSPQKPDARLLATTGAEIEVKVITSVSAENVRLSVADKDQESTGKVIKLQHPNKAASTLDADHQQKLTMLFELKDSLDSSLMVAHQVFVKLTSATGQEIIFVAEPDSKLTYKFELNVGARGKDFAFKSGTYSLSLIVGDAVLQNPFEWSMANVALRFQEGTVKSKVDPNRFNKKPEIKHMFREPEKRPPAMVSTIFTALVFVPIIVMFVAWMKLGVNVGNFPMSLSAIGFHLSLGAIFILYYFYWTTFTMFETLRYLGFIGVPAFLFGNRLLGGIAANRK